MNRIRRSVLGGLGAATAMGALIATGLLRAGEALAAWNKAAFDSKTTADALKSLGAGNPAASKDILIKAPDIAENGAQVPIEVTSRIPGTQSISIIADKNPLPLIGTFNFPAGGEAYVSTRMKMGQTSNVLVVVKAGDKYFSAAKEVKVTIGGCGG
jgi:sulfur-oxidizing protein SoxY